MNRVVALICTAGLLGTAYFAYPLRAQSDEAEVKEAPKRTESIRADSDDSVRPRKVPTIREAPQDREEGPRSSDRPKEAEPARRAFGRMFDEVDDRPRANVPGVPGAIPGVPHHMGRGQHADRDVMFRRRFIVRQVPEEISEPVPPEEQEEHKQFRAAIHELKDAKDDTNKKDEVAKTIRELLNKQFERDLAHRENELAAVEERVKTLRKQLDKRKSAKDEIISLRVKTIVNDVDGLGFPGEEGFKDDPNVRGLPGPAHVEHRIFDHEHPGEGRDSEATPRAARPGAFPRPRPSPVR